MVSGAASGLPAIRPVTLGSFQCLRSNARPWRKLSGYSDYPLLTERLLRIPPHRIDLHDASVAHHGDLPIRCN